MVQFSDLSVISGVNGNSLPLGLLSHRTQWDLTWFCVNPSFTVTVAGSNLPFPVVTSSRSEAWPICCTNGGSNGGCTGVNLDTLVTRETSLPLVPSNVRTLTQIGKQSALARTFEILHRLRMWLRNRHKISASVISLLGSDTNLFFLASFLACQIMRFAELVFMLAPGSLWACEPSVHR